MTAQTPAFGIKYIVQGEPVRNTRQALEDNANTIEAALLAGGVAPPQPADWSSLLTRVTALEGVPPTFAALNTAVWQDFPAWARLHYWRQGNTAWVAGLVQIKTGVSLATGSETVVTTLPVGMRPPVNIMDEGNLSGNIVVRLDIETSGQVQVVNTTAAALTAGQFVVINAFWSLKAAV